MSGGGDKGTGKDPWYEFKSITRTDRTRWKYNVYLAKVWFGDAPTGMGFTPYKTYQFEWVAKDELTVLAELTEWFNEWG